MKPSADLASIIILAHNEYAHTKACLESIRAHTPQPHELILVDNASTDGVPALFKAAKRRGAFVITNGTNRGYAPAVNQALTAARGKYIVLLNNDCIVTHGWLARLIQATKTDREIGMVGPLTSRTGDGPQNLDQQYSDAEGLAAFASVLAKQNVRRIKYTYPLFGFCVLITRECYNAIGPLDQSYPEGLYTDNDACFRAARAGFRMAIALDVFVHHSGGATFEAIHADMPTLMSTGETHFIEKWTRQLTERPPTVAALYAVHDDCTWLRQSLSSIYDSVSSIHVVASVTPWAGEPGNTDAMAHLLGTFADPQRKLKRLWGVWQNEAEQRNVGLREIWRSGYDYAAIIDGDEVYDPAEFEAMLAHVATRPAVEAWLVPQYTYWKSPQYRIDPPEPYHPLLFLRRGRHITEVRESDAAAGMVGALPEELGRAHHLSYCRDDAACLAKVQHFSHSAEVDPGWFDQVWRGWDADHGMQNLHPVSPALYHRAVPVPPRALPPVLRCMD